MRLLFDTHRAGTATVVVSVTAVGDDFECTWSEVVPVKSRGVRLSFVLSGRMNRYRSNKGGNW